MKSSRTRLGIERLEDRACPAQVNIGTGTGAVDFKVAGYTLNQNANITFATTSSGAFAFSEGSMDGPQQVTTLSGGMVSTTLNDAFDGALAFGIPNNVGGSTSHSTYADASGMADIVGAPVSGGPGSIVITGPGGIVTGEPDTKATDGSSFQGLEVSVQTAVFALDSTTPIIRSIGIATNPTADPITVTLGFANNFGSDSNTTIYATSNGGDFTPGVTRWIGSFQNYSGTTSSDPRLMFALQGPGTVSSPLDGTSAYVNGDDNPQFNYSVTVAPGETARLMVFCFLTGSKAKSTNLAQQVFDSSATVESNGLLAGLSTQQMSEIRNWSFAPSKLQPTFSDLSSETITYGSATTTFTGTLAAGSTGATGTLSVTISGNGITPVEQTATLGEGGNFSAIVNTGTLPAFPASPYTVTYDYAAQGNFLAANDATTTLTVNQVSLTVTADPNQGKTYGDEDPTLTYQITSGSLVNSDTLTGALNRSPGWNVGNYSINLGTLSAGSNYDLTFVGADFAISKANLNVAADADPNTEVQDAFFKTAGTADPALTYRATGFRYKDTALAVLSGSLTRDPGETLGAYAVRQGTLVANGNYNISFTDGVLNIRALGGSIVSTQIDDGNVQRSVVRSITLTFSAAIMPADIPAALAQVRVTRMSDNLVVGMTGTLDATGTKLTVRFTGTSVLGGSLADGWYSVSYYGKGVTSLHRLFGDIDGNAEVNAADQVEFNKAMNTRKGLTAKYNQYFDYAQDGLIINSDLTEFLKRLGKKLAPIT